MSDVAVQIDPGLARPPGGVWDNPTVWLFAADLAAFCTAMGLHFAGAIGHATAACFAFVCLYCFYTVAHEAVHGIAHPNRSVNLWLGRVSAALQGITFPLLRAIHLQHHAFTNDPIRDPDFVIGRQPRWLLPVWTLVRLFHDNHFMVRRGLWAHRRRQLREHLVTVAIQFGLLTTGATLGGFDLMLWGWVMPMIAAGAALELTVAWAVHYPHTSQHPLENTRMFHGRVWQILMLNQNYHLVHHLWPRIPWFRCPSAVEAATSAVAAHRAQAG